MFAASGRRQPLPQGNEEPTVDPREIDKTLSEIAGMLGRWSLFKKFLLESLSVRVMPGHSQIKRLNLATKGSPQSGEIENNTADETPARTTSDEQQNGPPLDLEQTGSQKIFNSIIVTYFIPLEIWYTRTIIDKVGQFMLPLRFCLR